MTLVMMQNSAIESRTVLPTEYIEPRWYAAYSWANHEKRVAEQLGQRSVEHFLPLYECVRGYVFVRLALRDRLRVLQIPSVVRLVGFSGLPSALPDEQMEALRNALAHQLRAEPHPYLTAGRCVRIIHGPLQGLEGLLVRKKGKSRVVLSVELISRSIAVELEAAEIELVSSLGPRS